MRRRTEKTKKARGQSWTQKASCFVCDEEIVGRGIPLLVSSTSHSNTGLPTKIGQLMGDGFMVVVAMDDMVCRRCSSLLNHLDKLEADLLLVKEALVKYLKSKYRLTDEDQKITEEQSMIKLEPDENSITQRKSYIQDQNEVQLKYDSRKTQSQQMKYEYINEAKELELSGSDCEGGTKRVNVEIILDESNSQWRSAHQTSQPTVVYTCDVCEFESEHQVVFQQHHQVCKSSHQCTICGKKFESNKNVQNHIMKAHLSKWTCHFCNKNFNEETDFTEHMKIHLGTSYNPVHTKAQILPEERGNDCKSLENLETNYECNICDFQSNNKVHFDNHVRKHVVLKLFKCNECGKRFEDKDSLTKHEKTHEPVFFKCGVCSVAFEKLNDLMDHLKIHKGSKESDVITESLATCGDSEVKDNVETVNQCDIVILRTASEQSEFINQSEMSVDDIDSQVCSENKSSDSRAKENSVGFQFHTCNLCSLTFVNDSLFEQHVKNHNHEEFSLLSINKEGNMDSQEHSDVISLVDPQNFVESVLEDSLEDVFEKMHSQSKLPTDMREVNNYDTQNQEAVDSKKDMFKCDSCTKDFNNDVDLQLHRLSHHVTNTIDFQNKKTSESQLKNLNQDSVCHNSCDVGGQNENQSFAMPEDKTDNHIEEKISEINVSIGNEIGLVDNFEVSDYTGSLQTIYDIVNKNKLTSVELDNFTIQNEYNEEIKKTVNTVATPAVDKNATHDETPDVDGRSVGTKKTFVCAMCGYWTSNMVQLRVHFKGHKEEKSHKCNICNKVLPNRQKLTNHLNLHSKFSGQVTCPYCYEELADKMHLHQHLQEKHQKDRIVYQCQFCSKKFPTKKAYKLHEETHPERLVWKCDRCDQTFKKEKQLRDHHELTHREPLCRFCGKEIHKLKTLRSHELRHLREKDSYECDVCKRIFKTKTGLRHHVAVHTGEYKYCCDYCGRGFMSRMMMEEHRSMHTKEERYVCDVCGRKFSFQSTYWIHRKWHDNPYPYRCSYCGRMFRHSSLLAVHKRKHTGERPYKCPHCPLTFPVGGTLKRHLILHTGAYPFNCENCKRGFTTRHKYATHLAKIHGDFELLNAKVPQNEFKMVIREEPQQGTEADPNAWQFADDSQQGEINFKLEVAAGDDNLDNMETGIPCSIVSDDLLENIAPTRVVEIVLDDASQAVATVTLADTGSNMLPDLWYQ